MRKLAWAALPYAAAVLLAYYVFPIKGLPYLAAALFAIAFIGLAFHGNRRKCIMIVFTAAAVGFVWYAISWTCTVTPCEKYDGETMTVTARVTDYTDYEEHYSRLYVRLADERLPRVKAQLIYYGGDFSAFEPGDEIQTTVSLSVEEKSYIADGYVLCGFAKEDAALVGRWGGSWLYFPQRLCRYFRNACDSLFRLDTAPLIKAIMTGDKHDLYNQPDVYAAMQICGVGHIAAVSGMHVMFLVALIQMLFGKGRFSSLLCLPLLLIFVLMTGAQPSVIRAAVLQVLFLLAPLIERENDSITSLSFALAILLIRNPAAIGSISLQLSFAAAAGLVLLLPPMGRWVQEHVRTKVGRFAADSVVCSIAATAFSMPIAALYFGSVPLLSVLINLMTLWVLEYVFCIAYVLSVLALILPKLIAFAAWIPAAAVWLCEKLFVFAARLPFACAYTRNPAVVCWLLFLYGSVLVTHIGRRKGRPWRYYIPAALSVSLLCLVLVGTSFAAGKRTEITVLNVGQGECVCLCDGAQTVLVDCGGKHTEENAGGTAAAYIGGSGRRSVELLVLTHLHEDHVNGVEQLLYRMPVRRLVYYADCEDADVTLQRIRTAAEKTGTEIIPIEKECAATVGNIDLSFCLPLAGEEENERGIAVAANIRGTDILITGDLDENGEWELVADGRAKADILVCGHHGSKYSSSAMFLQVLSPEWGIVSVGQNSYGHPTEETMERLNTYCEQVRRTDLDGDITIRIQ